MLAAYILIDYYMIVFLQTDIVQWLITSCKSVVYFKEVIIEFPYLMLYRVIWKEKKSQEYKGEVEQRKESSYFAYAIISTVVTVNKYS